VGRILISLSLNVHIKIKWEKVGRARKSCEDVGKLAFFREKMATFSRHFPHPTPFLPALGASPSTSPSRSQASLFSVPPWFSHPHPGSKLRLALHSFRAKEGWLRAFVSLWFRPLPTFRGARPSRSLPLSVPLTASSRLCAFWILYSKFWILCFMALSRSPAPFQHQRLKPYYTSRPCQILVGTRCRAFPDIAPFHRLLPRSKIANQKSKIRMISTLNSQPICPHKFSPCQICAVATNVSSWQTRFPTLNSQLSTLNQSGSSGSTSQKPPTLTGLDQKPATSPSLAAAMLRNPVPSPNLSPCSKIANLLSEANKAMYMFSARLVPNSLFSFSCFSRTCPK
jgi:hypothetical protein